MMTDSANPDAKLNRARKKAVKLSLHKIAFMLVVCMDRKAAKCCSCQAMNASWRHLKQRCKQWRKAGGRPILRIKSECIGICKAGPIIGVMPDGVWYGGCTPEVIDRIFDEHLAAGQVVSNHLIASPAM